MFDLWKEVLKEDFQKSVFRKAFSEKCFQKSVFRKVFSERISGAAARPAEQEETAVCRLNRTFGPVQLRFTFFTFCAIILKISGGFPAAGTLSDRRLGFFPSAGRQAEQKERTSCNEKNDRTA